MKKKLLAVLLVFTMVFSPLVSMSGYDMLGIDEVHAASNTDITKKRPVIKKIASVDDAYITVSWSKLKGASGYQIYRATHKDGSYKKIASVNSSSGSYRNKSVSENTKYYYKVRAYKKIKASSGKIKTVYSKYSLPKWGIVRVNPLELKQIREDAEKKHKELNTGTEGFKGLEKYTPKDDGTFNLLTDEEVASLYNAHEERAVSPAKAKEDIDLYFRTLESAYGAYYYFGAEKFEKAKKEMLAWADKQKGKISAAMLSSELTKKISFVRDAHFNAGEAWGKEADKRIHHYYYCLKYSYQKDEKGYFTYLPGSDAKWYVKDFSDKRVSLKPTLRKNGAIVYAPTLICTDETAKNCTVQLEGEGGKLRKETIVFTKSKAFDSKGSRDFKKARENGLAYISIRTFDKAGDHGYPAFEQSGTELKDAELIIFDIRDNNGGSDEFGRRWVKNFAGKEPKENSFFAIKNSKIRNINAGEKNKNGGFLSSVLQGEMIPSDIPILVLVDNQCGSSGESMLNYLKSLENTLVIGSNSAGYQIAGNVHGYRLPNTGMYFDFGTSFSLFYDSENVDYKGYEPDVWCNPSSALDAVAAMMAREDPDRDFSAFFQAVENTLPKHDIKLRFGRNVIEPNTGFGDNKKYFDMEVLVDGKVTKNYTVTTDGNDVISCTKGADGKIKVKGVGYGVCIITIQVGTDKVSFRFHRG